MADYLENNDKKTKYQACNQRQIHTFKLLLRKKKNSQTSYKTQKIIKQNKSQDNIIKKKQINNL